MYQVGDARNPRDNDSRFDDETAALDYARQRGGNTVWAVWRWDGELPVTVALVFDHDVYRP